MLSTVVFALQPTGFAFVDEKNRHGNRYLPTDSTETMETAGYGGMP